MKITSASPLDNGVSPSIRTLKGQRATFVDDGFEERNFTNITVAQIRAIHRWYRANGYVRVPLHPTRRYRLLLENGKWFALYEKR